MSCQATLLAQIGEATLAASSASLVLKMQSSSLLPFHSTIVSEIHDPTTSDLLVIARGLGLRRIICSLLKIYYSPESLIVLVGAVSPDEDLAIASELSTIGVRNPGLRIVDYEMQRKERRGLIFMIPMFSSSFLFLWKAGALSQGRHSLCDISNPSCRSSARGPTGQYHYWTLSTPR